MKSIGRDIAGSEYSRKYVVSLKDPWSFWYPSIDFWYRKDTNFDPCTTDYKHWFKLKLEHSRHSEWQF
jgi:hypothetical protein